LPPHILEALEKDGLRRVNQLRAAIEEGTLTEIDGIGSSQLDTVREQLELFDWFFSEFSG
jgi:hypothetical protein